MLPLVIAHILNLVVVLISFSPVEMNLRNEMKYSISFDNVVLMASTLLRVAENSLATFPLHDLDNVYCWLSTIISGPTVNDARLLGIGFVDTFFSIGNFSMDVSCTSCTSPDFDDLILSLYAVENVTELENNIREKAGSLLEAGFVQDIIDQVVRASAKQCPHRVEYDPNATLSFLRDPEQTLVGFMGTGDSVTKTPWFNIANTVVAGCIFVFGVLCRWLVNRRNKKWVKSLTREGAFLLEKQHEKERKMEVMLETYTSSLFRSPHIPRNIQWGVPIALIVNIGLYMGAHLGTLSVVNIDASLGGESFTIYDFLEFTFIGSTIQTYNNGGAEMAILIWIFTGFWPYLKLLVSLLLWMLPPGRLSVARRGRILLWIDTLATLSAVDIIVMLLGLALLLVFVGGPDEALSAGGVLYSTKAIVIPRAGFYCFIVAQRMSRVSSRFFLEYHERVLSMATRDYERKQRLVSSDGEEDGGSTIPANSNGNSQALNSSFENQSEDSGEILASEVDQASADRYRDEELPSSGMVTNKQLGSVRPISRDEDRATSPAEPERQDPSVREEFRWGTLGVIFGGITIFIVFIIGAIFAPSISLDASSVAGLAAESGKTYEEVVNEYGVFLVASGVLVKARFVLNTKFDFVGLLFLAVAAVVSIGMVFFIQAYQFIRRKIKERQFGPKMPSFGHKGCGLPSYICLQKWKHMEIYLISVAIGVWQLGSIASYAIHSYCDILGQVYDVFTYIGLVEASSAQCYRLQATLPGNLIIVCGSFVILILAFAFQATAQYRENVTESLRWIDGDDVPRLSLAWSSDKSKNKRYLHLIESLSFDQQYLEGDIHQPETPSTRATTPPGTPPRLICPTEFASPQSSNSFGFQTPPRGHCPQIPLRISNSNASRDASLLHARLEDDVLSTPSRSGFDMERLPSVMRDELSEAEDYVSVTWKDISHRTSRRTPSYLPSFGIPTRIDHAYEAASSSFGLPDFVHYSSSSYLRGTPSVITYDSAPPGSPSIADTSDEIPSTPTRINHAGGGHSYFL